ncbi:hypothetical protein [Dokdonia sp.]|uniref:hypothetical protein n=1 Tax=Dokdonia sp. TaxID=2024995 RepID=UPI0032678B07
MFKKYIYLIIIILPAVCFSQLLPNGSFEKTNSTGRLANYVYKDTLYQHIDTTEAYIGKQSAKFNYTKKGIKTLYFYGNREVDGKTLNYIPVVEGQEYELSFYFKTSKDFKSGLNRGLYGQFSFKDRKGKTVGFDENEPQTSIITDEGRWKKVTLSTKITHNVSQIAAGIFYRGNGTAWVDDFSLTLITKNASTFITSSFEVDSISIIHKAKNRFQKNNLTPSFSTIEIDPKYTYLGSGALTYKGTSKHDIAYYFNNETGASDQKKMISVHPNDTYTVSGYSRVSKRFKGKGSRISVLFYDAKGTLISTKNSRYANKTKWSRVRINAIIVPENATHMTYRVDFQGKGRFWFDNISIKKENLITNSGFETDVVQPNNKPDFWRPRLGDAYTISTTERDSSIVFPYGKTSAKFMNTSGIQNTAYYYGPYTADGSASNRIPVIPKETYELSAQIKTQEINGKGVRIALLFYDGEGNTSKSSSNWSKDTIWSKKTIITTVPDGYNYMEYIIEYSGNSGEAWFDSMHLKKNNSEWYHPEVSIDSFASLQYAVTSRKSLQSLQSRFETFHKIMEKNYSNGQDTLPPGTWKNPYGCPWVRLSANAVIGYLNANEVIPNKVYVERAEAALDFLLRDQEENGSFGLHRLSDCNTATFDQGSVMYEGSIAAVALLTGYRLQNKHAEKYLESAKKLCDYLVKNISPSVNANFNGFAIWALAEYNAVAPKYNEEYLKKSLDYFERIHAFQLENGMWDDAHNQLIHYHGIITRGLVNLYRIMPDDHPKKEVVRHSMYKAINHIIKRQRLGGKYSRSLGNEKLNEDNFPMESILMAYKYLGYSELQDVLNDLTIGSVNMSPKTSQGHRFASLGVLINTYYNKD